MVRQCLSGFRLEASAADPQVQDPVEAKDPEVLALIAPGDQDLGP
jgi:hypothetical protein